MESEVLNVNGMLDSNIEKAKYKKSESSIQDHTTKNDGKNDTKEEKLRKRQESLAAWKKKKATESKNEAVPTRNNKDEKHFERSRLRLEAWKKKRLGKTDINELKQGNKQIPKINIGLKLGSIKTMSKGKSLSLKRPSSIFNNEDEGESNAKKSFVEPKFDASDFEYSNKSNTARENAGSDNEEETFENLLQNIEMNERKAKDNQIIDEKKEEEIIENEALDNELALDEYEKEQELLETKLKIIQNKEKMLDYVDHNEIEYAPFRKCFYKETAEVSNISNEKVQGVQSSNERIKVIGSNCPMPIHKWHQLGLSSVIMNIIENKKKFEKPSPIQAQALPAIMSGRDIIGIAKTGSGKTLSFLLPLLRHVQDQEPLKENDGPIALVMAPTRELAQQIHKELYSFTKKLNISSACCYGGSSIEPQIGELKRGVQVLVGTPGRLIDLLATNNGRIFNLKRITYLVLDEADRMFDLGFEPQITKICSRVRPDRQTILFSATFPRSMELLAKKMLNDGIQIIVGGVSVVAPEIKQRVELVEGDDIEEAKFQKLLEVLKATYLENEKSKVLIFVEKQTAADNLLVRLIANNYPCLAIHGGKDQVDRKYAIREFSSPEGVNILLATSIAARGLDVKGLNLVVNFEAANHMEDYVHRVGRTGRAGERGTAITFVSSKEERAITELVKALRLSRVPDSNIDPRLIEISNIFLDKVKSGKSKFSFGFGGKGLDKLDEVRNANLSLSRKVFNEEDNPSPAKTQEEKEYKEVPSELNSSLPEFQIIEGKAPETSGPDISKFHARITINDLPQKARWTTVNKDSISKIVESTNTSITSKGQYYPPNAKIPKGISYNKDSVAPPKLYLLVEGITETSVSQAISLIRQKMIEGLEASAREDMKMPTGRYKV